MAYYLLLKQVQHILLKENKSLDSKKILKSLYFPYIEPKLNSLVLTTNTWNFMSLLLHRVIKHFQLHLFVSSVSYVCISKHPHTFSLPSCWRSSLSTALLDVAISTGRRRSVFLALMSAPKSSSKFTISVLGFWAAAWSGVSQYLPLWTSAPVRKETGMILKKQLWHE